MEEEREVMARNTLFLAVTRPALFAGIPIEAAVVILLTSVIRGHSVESTLNNAKRERMANARCERTGA